MSENTNKEIHEKEQASEDTRFTRRQFLERTGLVAGGAVLASIALTTGCGTSAATSPPVTQSGNTDTTASPSTVTASSPPTSNPATTTSSVPTSTPTAAGTSPVATYNYVPPAALPKLLSVPDTECTVADDGRVYSADHIWVKSLSANIAVLGITTSLVEMIAFPYRIELPEISDILARDDAFAQIEGYKLTADIISPVSGTVIQINDFLLSFNKSTELEPLVNSAYNGGWLVVVQLSKPDELKSLMTATSYRDLMAKH